MIRLSVEEAKYQSSLILRAEWSKQRARVIGATLTSTVDSGMTIDDLYMVTAAQELAETKLFVLFGTRIACSRFDPLSRISYEASCEDLPQIPIDFETPPLTRLIHESDQWRVVDDWLCSVSTSYRLKRAFV